jgi:hypothetical protein
MLSVSLGEWSIKAIQAEGTRYQQTHGTVPVTLSDASLDSPQTTSKNHEFGFYTVHYEGAKGRLVISNTSVRFTSHDHINPTSEQVQWTLPYSQMERIEKIDRIVGKNIPKPKSDSGRDLKLQSTSGQEWVLKNVDMRDQMFSQIVGFSDVNWQIIW